jgi:hypothetical protein
MVMLRGSHICVQTPAILWVFFFVQPGSGGYATSTAAAGGADGGRFGGSAAQGAVGQYGGPYAAVYGAPKVVYSSPNLVSHYILIWMQLNLSPSVASYSLVLHVYLDVRIVCVGLCCLLMYQRHLFR